MSAVTAINVAVETFTNSEADKYQEFQGLAMELNASVDEVTYADRSSEGLNAIGDIVGEIMACYVGLMERRETTKALRVIEQEYR